MIKINLLRGFLCKDREASLYDNVFMILNKIQNNNLFMRKIIVLQVLFFILFPVWLLLLSHKNIKDIRKKMQMFFQNLLLLRKDMVMCLSIGGTVTV